MTLGEENHNPLQRTQCWRNDQFLELNTDDQLWAYACHASEELCMTMRWLIGNPVLYHLLKMGIFNWKGRNMRMNQATQAIQHSTTMVTHLMPWIIGLEDKVHLWSTSMNFDDTDGC